MLEDYARLDDTNDVCRTALGSAACIIQPVICEFQRQIWLRMASVAQIELDAARPAASKLGPADGVHLTAYEREERLELDSVTNAAVYLTPPHTQRSRLMAGAKTTRVRKDGST